MSRIISFAAIIGPIVCCLVWASPHLRANPPANQADDAAIQKYLQDQTAPLGGRRRIDQGVLQIALPRNDLWVQGDMGEIPTAAGVESDFYVFRCSCGKDRVVGQFALAEYEVNDVIDALRSGHIQVVSVAGMFTGEKPRVMILRFQGEGVAPQLAKTLKSALDCVGEARTAHQPIATPQP